MIRGSARVLARVLEPPSPEEQDHLDRSTKKIRTTKSTVGDSHKKDMMMIDVHNSNPLAIVVAEKRNENTVKLDDSAAMKEMLDVKKVPKASYKEITMRSEGFDEVIKPEEIVSLVLQDYVQPNVEMEDEKEFNPCPEIRLSLEEYEEWCRPWRNTLIVKLLGRRAGYKAINYWIHKNWQKQGAIKIVDLEDDFFLVKFESVEDYKFALFEGPWKLMDHYILVQRWRPQFETSKALEVAKVAVWARIPQLPMELYNEKFIWRIGASLGTMLKIDKNTSLHSRGKFARVCIEVNLNRQLVPRVKILGKEYNVEYEGLHLICFNCGTYGHKKDNCILMTKEQGSNSGKVDAGVADPVETSKAAPDTPVSQKEQEDDGSSIKIAENEGVKVGATGDTKARFGEWMVNKKMKKFRKPPLKLSKQGVNSGTRFDVLVDEEEIVEPVGGVKDDATRMKQDKGKGSMFKASTLGSSATTQNVNNSGVKKGQSKGNNKNANGSSSKVVVIKEKPVVETKPNDKSSNGESYNRIEDQKEFWEMFNRFNHGLWDLHKKGIKVDLNNLEKYKFFMESGLKDGRLERSH